MINFNLSILKEIDFTNNENLVFLGIFVVLILVALSIVIIIIRKIIRIIKKLIIRIFNIEVKKPKFNQKTSEWLHKSKKPEEALVERKNAPKPEPEFIRNFEAGEKKLEVKDAEKIFDEKEAKDIAEKLNKLKGGSQDSEDSQGAIQKFKVGSTIKIPVSAKVGVKNEEGKSSEKTFDEKEENDIAEKLNKLKGIDPASSEDSKGAIQKTNLGSTIKIPTPKRFQVSGENQSTPAQGNQNPANGFSKVAITSSHGTIKPSGAINSQTPTPTINFDKNGGLLKSSVLQSSNPLQKPDFLEDNLSPHSAHKNNARLGAIDSDRDGGLEENYGERGNGFSKQQGTPDASIFGGKSEISRERLEHKLEDDASVWKASKQAGLTMNKIERAGLVKKLFSPVYGRNISKTDLKQEIKKLNEKMVSTTNSATHAKIRKEIKFFKKIGGVK